MHKHYTRQLIKQLFGTQLYRGLRREGQNAPWRSSSLPAGMVARRVSMEEWNEYGRWKVVPRDEHCETRRVSRALLYGVKSWPLLHIPTGTWLDKKRVRFGRTTLQGACHFAHQAVKRGAHAVATVGSGLLAAIAAGFLRSAERMPAASSEFRSFDRVHPYPAGLARWASYTRYYFWTGKKRSTEPADCYLCAQRAMVDTACARSSHSNPGRLDVEHGNASRI